MIVRSRFLAGLALAAAASAPAFAQTDLLRAPKVACTPESVTRCSNGQCTTKPATAKDKADVLVIDFAAKKAGLRRGKQVRPFADIVEDNVAGQERQFALAEAGESGARERLRATLTNAGKLTLKVGANGNLAQASCTIES